MVSTLHDKTRGPPAPPCVVHFFIQNRALAAAWWPSCPKKPWRRSKIDQKSNISKSPLLPHLFAMFSIQNQHFGKRFRLDNILKTTFEASVAAVLWHFRKFHTLFTVGARGCVPILRKKRTKITPCANVFKALARNGYPKSCFCMYFYVQSAVSTHFARYLWWVCKNQCFCIMLGFAVLCVIYGGCGRCRVLLCK